MHFPSNDLSELDELTEEHLGFAALSDGLGFAKNTKGPHPATQKGQAAPPPAVSPTAKSAIPSMDLDDEDEKHLPPRSFGTGATSAGPSGWATPSKPTPTWTATDPSAPQRPMPSSGAPGVFQAKSGSGVMPSAPTKPFANINPAALTGKSVATAVPTAAPRASAASAAAPSAAQVLAEPAAPQGVRLAAFMLDAAVILIPLSLAWIVSFGSASKEIFLLDRRPPLFLFSVIFAAYFLLSESFGGQSLGKMAFGLQVVEDDKYEKPTNLRYAFVRLLLTIAGTACAGLGLLASYADPKRRPWQDRYTGSIVRRKA